jgi:hypothetical protein
MQSLTADVDDDEWSVSYEPLHHSVKDCSSSRALHMDWVNAWVALTWQPIWRARIQDTNINRVAQLVPSQDLKQENIREIGT